MVGWKSICMNNSNWEKLMAIGRNSIQLVGELIAQSNLESASSYTTRKACL